MRSELMKIGFCYDTKSDYGYSEENLEYTDFVSLRTVSEIGQAIEKMAISLNILAMYINFVTN